MRCCGIEILLCFVLCIGTDEEVCNVMCLLYDVQVNMQLLISVFHFSPFPGSFWVIAGAVLLIIIITGIISIVHCLRTTRGASRALNLPIPSLPEDRTPLNSEPDNPVPVSI